MDKKFFIADEYGVLYIIQRLIHFLLDLLFLNILMIFLHCNLDGSLSRRAPPYLQDNFDLLLDRFDTSPSPFLLVFKGELRGKNDCISGVGPFHSDSIFDIMFCWRRISSSKNYQNARPKCK